MRPQFTFSQSESFDSIMHSWQLFCEGRTTQLDKEIKLAKQQPGFGQPELEAINGRNLAILEAEKSAWKAREAAAGRKNFLASPIDAAYSYENQPLAAMAAQMGRIEYPTPFDQKVNESVK